MYLETCDSLNPNLNFGFNFSKTTVAGIWDSWKGWMGQNSPRYYNLLEQLLFVYFLISGLFMEALKKGLTFVTLVEPPINFGKSVKVLYWSRHTIDVERWPKAVWNSFLGLTAYGTGRLVHSGPNWNWFENNQKRLSNTYLLFDPNAFRQSIFGSSKQNNSFFGPF